MNRCAERGKKRVDEGQTDEQREGDLKRLYGIYFSQKI